MSEQEKRIQEIRERANAATAGEWEQANKSVRVVGTQLDYGCYKAAPTGYSGGICNCLGGGYQDGKKHPVNVQAVKNAEFIAHARQDIPYLLDIIESLQRERQEPEPLTCVGCTRLMRYCKACKRGEKDLYVHDSTDSLYATEPKGEHHD